MNQNCLLCNKHIPTGEALLVLRGVLDGSGRVGNTKVEGVMHSACVDYQGGDAKTITEKTLHEYTFILD